ncbi:hypothetical protein FA95DRAFT_1226286 [Auriscalpium vulgare]|uniref:Uncharacterized protein n=1 Tax=Auriscalpium vulgare TaxID=40419 RepID=A0ACB8RTM1_9AGAM|nr:hypothetical protein FA95DRAFT_1226286 [Auriscalpium vulgare]
MSGYSSIFASGLLATPRPYRTAESARASSPDIDMAIDTTPTNSKAPLSMYISGAPADADEDYFSPSRSRASSSASSTGPIPQPRLRRRRSSLTVATGAMGAIKSPLRSAGVAFQRTALTPATAGRARSGSVDMLAGMEDFGSTPNPHTGRMRSGSVGGAFNR